MEQLCTICHAEHPWNHETCTGLSVQRCLTWEESWGEDQYHILEEKTVQSSLSDLFTLSLRYVHFSYQLPEWHITLIFCFSKLAQIWMLAYCNLIMLRGDFFMWKTKTTNQSGHANSKLLMPQSKYVKLGHILLKMEVPIDEWLCTSPRKTVFCIPLLRVLLFYFVLSRKCLNAKEITLWSLFTLSGQWTWLWCQLWHVFSCIFWWWAPCMWMYI